MTLLEVKDIQKQFVSRREDVTIHAVNGVSFTIAPAETVALIGESGSGKSTVGRLVLRLLEPTGGEVCFDGRPISHVGRDELRRLRSQIQVVFQEPFESLDPRMSIGGIVNEPLRIHRRELSAAERRDRVVETLEHVGLGGEFYNRRPADLSGGQQQRVGIARAIVTDPQLVVLDEPTSSLDLSVRAQVLTLLRRLQNEMGMAYLFISHDIQTVEYISDRVLVMYLGQVVESGPTERVVGDPRHPYTRALLSAALPVDPFERSEPMPLDGEPPSPTSLPSGCFLYGRCPIGTPECAAAPVPLHLVDKGHHVACIKADDLVAG